LIVIEVPPDDRLLAHRKVSADNVGFFVGSVKDFLDRSLEGFGHLHNSIDTSETSEKLLVRGSFKKRISLTLPHHSVNEFTAIYKNSHNRFETRVFSCHIPGNEKGLRDSNS
jgi:hypothetical protein|tara:strand:- start:66 stop:401 length:336 start_codon:yes stop_codon:yes gene_type:complete